MISLKEYFPDITENQEANDLESKFKSAFSDLRISVSMYGNTGTIQIILRDDIHPDEFSDMVKFVESLGYKVSQTQSENQFDWDDDRYFYPRIVFSK
jgi:hypothetical protein